MSKAVNYGYHVKAGVITVNEEAAEKIRQFFRLFIDGESYITASKIVHFNHDINILKQRINNTRYIGDFGYPPIMSKELFMKAQEELKKRDKLKKSNQRKMRYRKDVVTKFIMPPLTTPPFDDPFEKASYQYSLIQEVNY